LRCHPAAAAEAIQSILQRKAKEHDHGVPRVPLAVAAGSGVVATTSISAISATLTHTANFVTGDEYRIPSRDPRPQSQIQDNRRDERGRHGKIILSKPG
jgi:hypothetical protein